MHPPKPRLQINPVWIGALSLAAAALVAAQPSPAPALEPGRWQLEVSLQGAPVKDPAPSSLCLSAEALGTLPERALLDAAMRGLPGSNASATPCTLTELKREGARSSWQARCNGPRGPMQGPGSAVLAAQSATVQQAFDVDTPLGPQTLKQTIRARRSGACS